MDKLAILWTSGDKETALDMVLMYTLKANMNKWWDECDLITWGPSNTLVCKDEEVQEQLRLVQSAGVKVFACKRCAERHGLVDSLKNLDIVVDYMGEPLTRYLKDGWKVITI
ncbi:MAG TPA: DsrE family protein [Anaerovoracaceae bacterium]|nr:DsrE family protein [Anaerovoracaceae bacterium]